mgnify:CR=1 FL=1
MVRLDKYGNRVAKSGNFGAKSGEEAVPNRAEVDRKGQERNSLTEGLLERNPSNKR